MSRVYLYNTGSYAKERLNAILASDRIGCNPDFIDGLKLTLKHELDRYVDVSEGDIDIQVKERVLTAYIPLMSIHKREDNGLHTAIGQGLDDYESDNDENEIKKEGCTELKTV